jgi:hypothetical protein
MKFENGNNEINLMPNGTRWVDISEIKHVMTSKKQGYSEEDMEEAFKVGFTLGYGSDVEAIDEKDECFNRWFEQFKKK